MTRGLDPYRTRSGAHQLYQLIRNPVVHDQPL